MNKKAILRAFVVAASFILLAVALSYGRELIQDQDPQEGAQSEMSGPSSFRDGAQITSSGASFLTPNDFLSNDPGQPNLHTWLVRCTQRTLICADVADVGFFNDNTFHVSTVCVEPDFRRGIGELKYAIAPEQNPSDTACAKRCREAVVSFQCEFNDFCDDAYNSILSCLDASFEPGFPKRIK